MSIKAILTELQKSYTKAQEDALLAQKAPSQAGVYYGVCNSDLSATTKTVSINEITALYNGLLINVLFTNSVLANSQLSLRLNSFLAASIRLDSEGHLVPDYRWRPGTIIQFTYHALNNYWIINNSNLASLQYYGVTKLSNDLDSESNTEAVTPRAVKDGLDSKVPVTRTINNQALSSDITLTASDVGALATNDTAVSASRLVTKHLITGEQGWYHFLDLTAGTSGVAGSRSVDLLIDNGASHYSGILKIYISGSTTLFIEWLTTTYPIDSVQWTRDGNTISLYIYKTTAASYSLAFTILSAINRGGTNLVDTVFTWDNTLVSELPNTATSATADISNNAATASLATFAKKLQADNFLSNVGASWYKFLEVPLSLNAISYNATILVKETYGYPYSGIISFYANRASNNVTATVNIESGSISNKFLKYYINTSTLTVSLYYKKQYSSTSSVYFYTLDATTRSDIWDISPYWKQEAATPPAESVFAAIGKSLWFTEQPVSIGANQQIISISDPTITENYVLARIEFADPDYITTAYSWNTTAGSFTITGTATAATTANILLSRRGNY